MSTAAPLGGGKDEESEKKDEMDDDTMFTTLGEEDKSKPSVAPRWATRVFAADCLCRVIMLCENANKAHFDLALARSARLKNPKSNYRMCMFGFRFNFFKFLTPLYSPRLHNLEKNISSCIFFQMIKSKGNGQQKAIKL